MGALLRKIQSQRAADSMDLRKASCEAISSCGKVAEKLRIPEYEQSFPQNPQSLRTPQPIQGNVFHKSANPQLVAGKNNNISPDPQAKLVSLAVQSGIFEQGYLLDEKEIAALVPPSDWRDVSHCSIDELKTWAAALAMRAVRYRGKVPRGWDKVANCAHCGPVYSFAAGDCLACPWCELKRVGKWFPIPNQNKS
jgi:hypothetical protein